MSHFEVPPYLATKSSGMKAAFIPYKSVPKRILSALVKPAPKLENLFFDTFRRKAGRGSTYPFAD